MASRRTFRGMVLHRMAFDRRRILITFVDKVAVREYCAERSKTIKMPRILQVVDSAQDLKPELWPDEVVLKPSFGSGAILMVTKKYESGLDYKIEHDGPAWDRGYFGMLKENLNHDTLRKVVSNWLSSDYEYWTLKFPEWAYGQIPKKVIVEELVKNRDRSPAVELRLHSFFGKVALIRVTNVVYGLKAATFSREGVRLEVRLKNDSKDLGEDIVLPVNWRQAVREAEQLSRGMDYLRIDLFSTDNGIYFSEITIYPNGGQVDFEPIEASRCLARLWRTNLNT